MIRPDKHAARFGIYWLWSRFDVALREGRKVYGPQIGTRKDPRWAMVPDGQGGWRLGRSEP